jgi:hypothetical protein
MNMTASEAFVALLKERPSKGAPVLWFENKYKGRLTFVCYGKRGEKLQQISGFFTLSDPGNVGYTEFGDNRWRAKAAFDGYVVKVLASKTDSFPKSQILDINLLPRDLDMASGEKAIRFEFHPKHATLDVNGSKVKVQYSPKPFELGR